MQTSQQHRGTSIHMMHHQPVQEIDPYCPPHFQILENSVCPDTGIQGKNVSFQTSYKEEYFTLESSSPATMMACDSPSAVSGLSNRSSYSPQGSHSYSSDHHHHPSDSTNSGSPVSGCSSSGVVDDGGNELRYKLRELEVSLLGPESDIVDSTYCCYKGGDTARWTNSQIAEMLPKLNLKNVLIRCAHAISEEDMYMATNCMEVLGHMVSVHGDPFQRLGAYMLEGLRARLERSGSMIYKTLKCEVPSSEELMTYMSILFNICPYWKFAYLSSNIVMNEALRNERRVHIIDFQIAQGSQYVTLIKELACQPGGPPSIRITGVDDSQSNHARGGGLHIVAKRLHDEAAKYNVPFEFNAAGMSGCEVMLEDLRIQQGEAIAVTFPYVLHHMPDESVSVENHRDRLLRLVRSLSPKVLTLVEQESNTNTSSFNSRFVETVDYYTAMFESIDAGAARDNKQRTNAETHCVARDIVNMVACEEAERVERHELFGKWKLRLKMDGFAQYSFGPSGLGAVRNLLKGFNENYRVEEIDGALYLGWKNRALVTSSAWICA